MSQASPPRLREDGAELRVQQVRELNHVAEVLLDHGFELSALELEREISERYGPAHGVQKLLTFLQSSIFTGGSSRNLQLDAEDAALTDHPALAHLDFQTTSFSGHWEPLAERNARIAVLEYELKATQERMHELQGLVGKPGQAAVAAEDAPESQSQAGDGLEDAGQLTPLEERMLNTLVMNFLRDHGHKRAAVAFDDSCGDFVDAGAVTGNHSLPVLYKTARAPLDQVEDLREKLREAQLESDANLREIVVLRERLEEAEERTRRAENLTVAPELQAALVRYDQDRARRDEPACADSGEANLDAAAEDPAKGSASARAGYLLQVAAEYLPPLLRQSPRTERTEAGDPSVGTGSSMQQGSFHTRHLLPLVFAAVADHADEAVRAALLQATLQALSDPSPADRRAILDELDRLGQKQELQRTVENEVLLSLVSWITAEAESMRLLVVDACRTLIPHVSPACREALIFAVLRQAMRDHHTGVKAAAVRALGVLVPLLPSRRALEHVKAVTWSAIEAENSHVSSRGVSELMPAVLRWCASLSASDGDQATGADQAGPGNAQILLEMGDDILLRSMNATEAYEAKLRHIFELDQEGAAIGTEHTSELAHQLHVRESYLLALVLVLDSLTAEIRAAATKGGEEPVASLNAILSGEPTSGLDASMPPRGASPITPLRWLCRRAIPYVVALAERVGLDDELAKSAYAAPGTHMERSLEGTPKLSPGLEAICAATKMTAQRLGAAFTALILVPLLLRSAQALLPTASDGDASGGQAEAQGGSSSDRFFAESWLQVLEDLQSTPESNALALESGGGSKQVSLSERDFATLGAVLETAASTEGQPGAAGNPAGRSVSYVAFLESLLQVTRNASAMLQTEGCMNFSGRSNTRAYAVLALSFQGTLPAFPEDSALSQILLKAAVRALINPPSEAGQAPRGEVVVPAIEASVAESLARAVAAALRGGLPEYTAPSQSAEPEAQHAGKIHWSRQSSWVHSSLTALWELVAEETEVEAELEEQHNNEWKKALSKDLDDVDDDASEDSEDGEEEEGDPVKGEAAGKASVPDRPLEDGFSAYDDLDALAAEEDEDSPKAATDDRNKHGSPRPAPAPLLVPIRRSEAQWDPDGPLGFLGRVFTALVPLLPATLVSKRLLPALFMLTEPRPIRGARSGRFGWQLLLQRYTTCALGLAGALIHVTMLPEPTREEVLNRLEMILGVTGGNGMGRGGWPLPASCYIIVRVLGKIGFVASMKGNPLGVALLNSVARSLLPITSVSEEHFEKHASTLTRIVVAMRRCATRLEAQETLVELSELERRLDVLDADSLADEGTAARQALGSEALEERSSESVRASLGHAFEGFRTSLSGMGNMSLFPSKEEEGN